MTAIVIVLLAGTQCTSGPGPVSLSYFYFPGCPTCQETARLKQLAGELIQVSRSHEGMSVRIYDIRESENRAHLLRLGAEYEIDVDALHLPTLFAGGEVYDGIEEIKAYVDSH